MENTLDFNAAYAFITEKLERELPKYLVYHTAGHTRDVVEATGYLAAGEQITGEQLTLLKTAALFHDTGYLKQQAGHEAVSCEIAEELLPQFGYSADQIAAICRMIMVTRFPHHPKDIMEMILCDADLFYLGSGKYDHHAAQLFKEIKHAGTVKSRQDWLLQQSSFLSMHSYFTETARKELDPGKQAVREKLESKIAVSFAGGGGSHLSGMLKDAFFMVIGILFAGYALKGFLVPNHFFDGGVTGISLLVHEIYHFNLAVVIFLLNLPLIAVSYFTVGSKFAVRMLIGVALLGICLTLLPDVALTNDKLLISIFGGVFLGIGIGLVMRSGAALDGIEVLALYTLKRTSFTITEIILGLNILIFSIAAFRFGIETALYSILTYFSATRCIDYVVEGIQAYTGVTIISGKSEQIKYQLVNNLGRGITVYKGERGFLPGKFEISTECDIIFTVITRLELRKLKNLVYESDPKAFVFANTIREASGGVLRKLHRH